MFKIKEFRHKNNYTQRYIAYKLGVSQQSVVKWEQGKSIPRIVHLVKLANLMQCSVDELVNSIEE